MTRSRRPAAARGQARATAPSRAPAPAGIAAVRGAVAVAANAPDAILDATGRLLAALCETNALVPGRIVSALFTATDDLDADYPAHAARRLGWRDVPLLCAREIAVPGGMPRVVRVLLTVSGVADGARLLPVYLDGAERLRPDLDAPPKAAAAGARRVAIIGLGQIGGAIGLALARTGRWHRTGFDLDRTALDAARDAGAIDAAAGSIAKACDGAALAIVAVPADAVEGALDAAAAALPAGAALADTCGARAASGPALARAAARGLAAAGIHPIAGNEGRGFAAARAGLFDGAVVAVSPVSGAVPDLVAALVGDLGARMLEVDPGAHDRALARTSHLPYLVACALRAVGADAARAGLAGPAFRDMTRVAGSDAAMALGVGRANAREVRAAWAVLRADVERRLEGL